MKLTTSKSYEGPFTYVWFGVYSSLSRTPRTSSPLLLPKTPRVSYPLSESVVRTTISYSQTKIWDKRFFFVELHC